MAQMPLSMLKTDVSSLGNPPTETECKTTGTLEPCILWCTETGNNNIIFYEEKTQKRKGPEYGIYVRDLQIQRQGNLDETRAAGHSLEI